jgi:hypothetical protein
MTGSNSTLAFLEQEMRESERALEKAQVAFSKANYAYQRALEDRVRGVIR